MGSLVAATWTLGMTMLNSSYRPPGIVTGLNARVYNTTHHHHVRRKKKENKKRKRAGNTIFSSFCTTRLRLLINTKIKNKHKKKTKKKK